MVKSQDLLIFLLPSQAVASREYNYILYFLCFLIVWDPNQQTCKAQHLSSRKTFLNPTILSTKMVKSQDLRIFLLPSQAVASREYNYIVYFLCFLIVWDPNQQTCKAQLRSSRKTFLNPHSSYSLFRSALPLLFLRNTDCYWKEWSPSQANKYSNLYLNKEPAAGAIFFVDHVCSHMGRV